MTKRIEHRVVDVERWVELLRSEWGEEEPPHDAQEQGLIVGQMTDRAQAMWPDRPFGLPNDIC